MGFKVLITGGAGYIGSALTEKLSHHPAIEKVVIYDNLFNGNKDFFYHTTPAKEKVQFIQGDILETRLIKKAVASVDIVLHLAAIDDAALDNRSAHHMEQVNHWGTAELTYAVEQVAISKLIFLSTSHVYGYSEEVKTEASELLPSTPWATSKARGEAHILRLQEKLNTVVLRIGSVAGWSPVKNFKGVANQFVQDAVTKNRLSIHGDGKQTRPVLHLAHLLAAIEKTVLENIPSGAYNLQQANPQILDLLEALKNIKPDLEFIFSNHHLHLPSVHVATKFNDLFSSAPLDLTAVYNEMLGKVQI